MCHKIFMVCTKGETTVLALVYDCNTRLRLQIRPRLRRVLAHLGVYCKSLLRADNGRSSLYRHRIFVTHARFPRFSKNSLTAPTKNDISLLLFIFLL